MSCRYWQCPAVEICGLPLCKIQSTLRQTQRPAHNKRFTFQLSAITGTASINSAHYQSKLKGFWEEQTIHTKFFQFMLNALTSVWMFYSCIGTADFIFGLLHCSFYFCYVLCSCVFSLYIPVIKSTIYLFSEQSFFRILYFISFDHVFKKWFQIK